MKPVNDTTDISLRSYEEGIKLRLAASDGPGFLEVVLTLAEAQRLSHLLAACAAAAV